MEKNFNRVPPAKRKYKSIKCNHIKASLIDQENLLPKISENIDETSDFTLILIDQNNYYIPDTTSNNSKADKIPPKAR
jgi:hypothetical protein